jgi:outer membrane protein OmpA-like peptidoglycan-associated protein
MKRFTILLIIFIFFTQISYSQFGLGKIIKRKVEEKVEKKTEEAVEKALEGNQEEEAEESDESENKSNKNDDENTSETTNEISFKSFSKFDFIPGDRIIFFEDFSQDNIGDFPVKWNTNGSGEVISTNLFPGKWLKMVNDVNYVPDIKHPFPENFTLEFDLATNFQLDYPYQFMGYFKFEIAKIEDMNNAVNGGYEIDYLNNEFEFQFKDVATAWIKGHNKNGVNISNNVDGKWLQSMHKKIIHISISANKQRYRMWINQNKIFDLPRILAAEPSYNILRFLTYSINQDKEYNVLISNIKFAEGSLDARSKLITEGKLVTNAITFDSGSDKIKPESYTMIKSISEVLASNPDVKIMIIGHTDSDGNAVKNQSLSEARSLSVKNILVSEFGVDGSRIQTSGKGDTLPVEDNSTSLGKAKNRRVEFVKM